MLGLEAVRLYHRACRPCRLRKKACGHTNHFDYIMKHNGFWFNIKGECVVLIIVILAILPFFLTVARSEKNFLNVFFMNGVQQQQLKILQLRVCLKTSRSVREESDGGFCSLCPARRQNRRKICFLEKRTLE